MVQNRPFDSLCGWSVPARVRWTKMVEHCIVAISTNSTISIHLALIPLTHSNENIKWALFYTLNRVDHNKPRFYKTQ